MKQISTEQINYSSLKVISAVVGLVDLMKTDVDINVSRTNRNIYTRRCTNCKKERERTF